MSIDLTIIAIVFALVLLLVFFSAVVLYLSFRIKETFRKETRRGATIAKTAFLIGILFLAGGMFYFVANSYVAINRPSASPTIAPTNSPSPSQPPTASPINTPLPTEATSSPPPSPTASTSPTPPTSTSPSTTSTPKPSGNPTATPPTTSPPQKPTLTLAYPATAKMNSTISITFTIINPSTTALQGATIQTNSLFQDMTLKSSNFPVVGNVINLGALQPGTTIVSTQLVTANHPQNINDVASLIYEGLSGQITQQILVTVRGN